MLTEHQVEVFAACVNAVGTIGLLIATWIYTRATKQMAEAMHSDFQARQKPGFGGGIPLVLKNTWDELSVRQEIINVGEYTFSIEGAFLELDGLISDGRSARILCKPQISLPHPLMPSGKIECTFVLKKAELEEHSHPNVSCPLNMYRAELAYAVKSLAGVTLTFRFPVGAS